ncbi:hypothetical protein ACFQY7_36055 [Actinomadura luteofluorescens]|uniref:terpene synthase family protein n=1 Tax=Actinomadura luteofluorescens TaxID=46163 RepID=UPI003639D906
MSDPALTVEIPSLYCPLRTRIHPMLAELEQRGNDWMAAHGFNENERLWRRVQESNAAEFFARICPDAAPERLQMAIDWSYLMFVFDDVLDEAQVTGASQGFVDIAARVVRTLADPGCEMMARATTRSALPSRTWRTASADTPPPPRSAASWTRTAPGCSGSRGRSTAQLGGTVPSLNDYTAMRPVFAAADPTLVWAEIALGAPISEGEMSSREVSALQEMTATYAAFSDDLYSLGKDLWFAQRQGGGNPSGLNLVNVFLAHEHCTIQEAITKAVDLCNRIARRFVDVRDKVEPHASDRLRPYVASLGHLMRGNIEWGLATPRYSNPDGEHPGAVKTICTWSDTPPPGTDQPPKIPSIAWWWEEPP